MTPDTSGRTSAKPFAYYDPESRSLRTSQGTDPKDSQPFSATVPKTGSMSGGFLFEHPTPEPRIDVSGSSSLLPTPMGSDGRLPGGSRKSPGLAQMAALKLLPTPGASDSSGGGSTPGPEEGPQSTAERLRAAVQWGEYEPAIRRWESLTRPAPLPTEPNLNGNPRLTVDFDEWVMGVPAGWIADVPIPYGAKIKLCGNGVVPQQAAAAIRYLTSYGAG